MPLPKQKKGESDKDYINRCMSDDIMNKEFPENKQRAGVCYSEERKSTLKHRLKNIGSGLKRIGQAIVPPKTAEQIAWEKKLKEKTAKAYREEYLKQAVKSSRERARSVVQTKSKKQTYNNQAILDNLMRL